MPGCLTKYGLEADREKNIMKNFNNRWQLPVDVSTVVRSQCLKGESRTQKKPTQGFIPIPCSAVFRICISFSAEPDPASYHNVMWIQIRIRIQGTNKCRSLRIRIQDLVKLPSQ